MTHVRKLELTGKVKGRDEPVSSSYSWPNGENIDVVNKIVYDFRKAFDSVSVRLEHNYID